MITQAQLLAVAARANLAPSVHNTQPARWHLARDGAVLVAGDLSRHLIHADPQFRDMGISCGAAVEGTLIALGDIGFDPVGLDDLWASDDRHSVPGHRLAARITLRDDGQADPLRGAMEPRFTWRGTFRPLAAGIAQSLQNWAAAQTGITLVHEPAEIAYLAARNDEAAMTFLRNKAFRRELRDWMRLSPSDTRYQRDGMNREALRMSRIEALGAGLVLGTGLFAGLDSLGLAKPLVGEVAKTRSASAVVLVHRPVEESTMESGRAFYRAWLDITRLGMSAWPMAALADDPVAAADCTRRYGLPDHHHLLNALRIGALETARSSRARLLPAALVV